MRGTVRLLSASLMLLLFVPPIPLAAASAGDSNYHIVLPGRAVQAGERVVLKLVPPPPPGASVAWYVSLTADEGIGIPGGIYFAPYLIPVGAPPAQVSVTVRDGSNVSFVRAEIALGPGSVPGAEDCLGPDQSFSIAAATLTPPTPLFSTWPNLIKIVEPVYPRSAFVRGVIDTINVLALVCRTGDVLDAHEALSYRDTDNPFNPDPSTLIEHDPRLVDAAVAAVRQYVFSPASVDGRPAAFETFATVIFNPAGHLGVADRDRGQLSVSVAPNPMNPTGTLSFTTRNSGRIRVTLYDIQGRQLGTLLDLPAASPGTRLVRIGESGAPRDRLATGIYFYRIETADGTTAGRFAVMK